MPELQQASDDTPNAVRGNDGRWHTTDADGYRGTFPAHWSTPPAGIEARAAWIAANARRDEANANPHAVLARHALRELQLARYAVLLAKKADPSL